MNQIQSSKVGEVFVEICNAVENDRMRGGQPGEGFVGDQFIVQL